MTEELPDNVDSNFEALLEYLRRIRSFDFTGYKRSTLVRRITGRMNLVGIKEYTDYIDYLEVHQEEFLLLFNTILINVTSFFRDPPAWEYLSDEILPRIINGKTQDEPIRCWCAGCASGEEAYTLAILLAEKLGISEFRRRVKLYATDVDEEALTHARQASYTAEDLNAIPEPLREKYFEMIDSRHVLREDIRRPVIFGRNDLVQDAPISRLDLLVSRNTLMYFNTETQAQILSRFHFALNNYGYLFLGKAEMLLALSNSFAPENLKFRIFSKIPRTGPRIPPLNAIGTDDEAAGPSPKSSFNLQQEAFDVLPWALLIVNPGGLLILANQEARNLFGISLNDLGRPFRDLEISYRPIELRSIIDKVSILYKSVKVEDVQWRNPETQIVNFFDVMIVPVFGSEGTFASIMISFVEVTAVHKLQEEIHTVRHELETTNEELHSTNEELETTNEELQSTVEELQTTNEELQSTNEEMETMNEELQATNEELITTNNELRFRTDELNQVNAFTQSILTGIQAGVIVIDEKFLISSWNHKAEDLWGIRADEALGQSLFNLDIGLPVEDLQPPVRDLLAGSSTFRETRLEATNRRGRRSSYRITCTPLKGIENEIQGVILLIEEEKAGDPKS